MTTNQDPQTFILDGAVIANFVRLQHGLWHWKQATITVRLWRWDEPQRSYKWLWLTNSDEAADQGVNWLRRRNLASQYPG